MSWHVQSILPTQQAEKGVEHWRQEFEKMESIQEHQRNEYAPLHSALSMHPMSFPVQQDIASTNSVDEHSFVRSEIPLEKGRNWFEELLYRDQQDAHYTELLRAQSEHTMQQALQNGLQQEGPVNAPSVCPFSQFKSNDTMACPMSTEQADFKSWVAQYRHNISHLIDDNEPWDQMHDSKLWLKHKSIGLGYEGFAWNHYQEYIFDGPETMTTPRTLELPAIVGLVKRGKLAESIESLEAGLKNEHALDPTWWNLLAEAQSLLGRDAQAIAAYHRIVRLSGEEQANSVSYQPLAQLSSNLSHQPPMVLLASLYLNENCIPEFLTLLTRYLQYSSRYAHLVDQDSLYKTPKQLFSLYLQAAKLNPIAIDPMIQSSLSLLLFQMEKYDLSLDCLNCCLENTTQAADPFLLNRLAGIYNKLGHVEKSIATYQDIQSKFPYYLRPFHNLAILAWQQGNTSSALQLCQQGLAQYPLAAQFQSSRPSELSVLLSKLSESPA